jgi:probable HAF family extracellular repeat protein
MKTIMIWIAASGLLAVPAIAQKAKHYTITDLGPIGNTPGQPYSINSRGLMGGAAASSATTMHAVLWDRSMQVDIGVPGLGGPNSQANGVNDLDQVVGQAESSVANGEDFCGFNAYGFPSKTACVPFLWQDSKMTALPTLGGVNGVANGINNRGLVVGFAENLQQDPGCPVFEFKPVIWNQGKAQQLALPAGDTVGAALAINAEGQAVGISGTCLPFNQNLGLYMRDTHAVTWQNGAVTDLGNLGGDGGFGGNHACAINNYGQVVGHSDLAGDTAFHAYIWSKATGMKDIGTLAGDFASLGLGINDGGVVVGASFDPNFNSRAFLWENGVMTDLNNVIPANSALYLQQAKSINASGEITGVGANGAGELHGFLATPDRPGHRE